MKAILLALVLLGLAVKAATALELPELAPAVRSITPLGARPGESVEVQISGRRLDGALDVSFARPDIRAVLVSSDFFSVQLKVTLGPRVPIGLQDYRLRTPRGTFVGVFHVSSLPRGRETEPNNDLERAQKIQLPVLIDAVMEGDDDVFRLHAEAGQTLIFDVLASRAGSTLDSALAVLDERGNELDFLDDYYIHKDPHLTFPVKRTGDYFVRVSSSEAGRGGGKANPYRLIAGMVPDMQRVLPLGAKRGAITELRVAGLNLGQVDRVVLGDGLAEGKVVSAGPDLVTVRLEVPGSVAPGRYDLHAFAGNVEAPLPIPLLVSDLEERLATPARKRAEPQTVQAPTALSGMLEHRREAHFFAFEARAGDRLVFDVDAMKLGYLVDPVVGIYSVDGQLLAWDDDRLQQNGTQIPNLDPYLVHTVEKDGRYVVMIRDLAERGNLNYVYRLSIYPAEPDFDIKGMTPEVTLYRGQTVLLPVRVRRHGGWDQPVEVWVENLPPGATNEKQVVGPEPTILVDNCALKRRMDGTDAYLQIKVSEDAAPGFYPIRVRGRGTMGGHTAEHVAEIQYKWESVGKVSGPITDQKLVATVTDLPAVLLDVPDTLELPPGKQTRFRVLVTRFDGGGGPLSIEPDTPLEGVTFENNVLAPGASQVELRITAVGTVKGGAFRLRAGPGLSQPITLRQASQEEVDE